MKCDKLNVDHVVSRIEASKIIDYPWPHLIVEDFLPQGLYDQILKEIDPLLKKPVLNKEKTRAYHIMANFSVGIIPRSQKALLEYYHILNSHLVWDIIEKKLKVDATPEDFYSELNLFTKGYTYDEVHPDRSDKLVTMLHYLADEGDDTSIGTFLYTPDKKGRDLDIFNDRLASAPYVKNTVLFFAPKDTASFMTNHCMANDSKSTFLRKSFQSFFLREKSDWTRDPQSGRVRI